MEGMAGVGLSPVFPWLILIKSMDLYRVSGFPCIIPCVPAYYPLRRYGNQQEEKQYNIFSVKEFSTLNQSMFSGIYLINKYAIDRLLFWLPRDYAHFFSPFMSMTDFSWMSVPLEQYVHNHDDIIKWKHFPRY